MSIPPLEITLTLSPRARLDVIDVSRRIESHLSDFSGRFKRALYCSYHTTAGYLEQSLCARLRYRRESLEAYVHAFQEIFPPGAGYHHDELHLRTELTDEQRCVEPRNGDSHLTYIGSGLKSCVTYRNRPGTSAYFIDLDGMNGGTCRERRTSVIGFNREELVGRVRLSVPVSRHGVDAVNIKDPRLGLYEELCRLLERHEIAKGRIELTLAPHERNAGLTVNEYETLLMKHDLQEVLRNPLRFVAEKGRNMMIDPKAIPHKTLNYAKYDFVQIVNKVFDSLGVSNSPLERMVDRLMAVPAARFLRMKRSVNLLVSDRAVPGRGHIVHGTYQSPILVQWDRTATERRDLDVTITRFR